MYNRHVYITCKLHYTSDTKVESKQLNSVGFRLKKDEGHMTISSYIVSIIIM